MEKYNIKQFDMKYYQEYKNLFLDTFGHEITKDKFEKKNIRNPFLKGDPIIYLIFHGDKVIGSNSFFPIEVNIYNTTYLGVQSGDSMISKEYRGKGLFNLILSHSLDSLNNLGYKFIIGLPNKNSYSRFLKLGFKSIDKLTIYSTIVNIKHINKLSSNKALKVISKLEILNNLLKIPRYFKQYKNLTIEKFDLFEDDIFDFIFKSKPSNSTTINNTKEYLKWKYDEKGIVKYIFRENMSNKTIGVLICSIEEGNSMDIIDYFLEPNSKYNLVHIVNTLSLYLSKNEKIGNLSIWNLNNKDTAKFKNSLGFVERDREIYYIYKNLSNDKDMHMLDNLPINKGYADVI